MEKNSIEDINNVVSENKDVGITKNNEENRVKDKEKKIEKKEKKNINENVGNIKKKHNLRDLNKKNKVKEEDKYKSNKKERNNSSVKKDKQEDIYTPMKMSNKKRLRNTTSNFKTPINCSANLTTTEKTNKTKNNTNNKRRITKGKRLNM